MDGIHDLGGLHGFGPVNPTTDDPPFHAPWEGRTHGVHLASNIAVPGGSIRPYIERIGHAAYLTTSYYEHWLAAVEDRLVIQGVVTEQELADRRAAIAAGDAVPQRHDPEAAAFVRSLFRPFNVEDPEAAPSRFQPGDQVRVKRIHPAGHTRCPRYVRGAQGTIALVHAAHPLPDKAVQGEVGPEPYYSVGFSPDELWGDDAEPGRATILVDLWESYLEEPTLG